MSDEQDRAPPPSAWSRNVAAAAEGMKGNGFGDRARQLTEWFQAWNSCEQTIALYSLLSKVSAVQARFLSLVLEHSLKNGYDSKELTRLEKLANDSSECVSVCVVCVTSGRYEERRRTYGALVHSLYMILGDPTVGMECVTCPTLRSCSSMICYHTHTSVCRKLLGDVDLSES